MLYSPTGGADVIKLRWAISPPATSHRPNYVIRDGTGMRLVAAMAEPHLAGRERHYSYGLGPAGRMSPYAEDVAETDAQYFRRRAGEERRAADEAAGPEARAAHGELAERYARLSERRIPRSRFARPRSTRSASFAHRPSAAERKRHFDERLDEALLETFPASDPVSIVHVR